jgi:hypothetical protein
MKRRGLITGLIFTFVLISCGENKQIDTQESTSGSSSRSSGSQSRPVKGKLEELPVILASGSGEDIEWKQVKEQADKDEIENGFAPFFYNDCSQGTNGFKIVSSTLAPQSGRTYSKSNLGDSNPMTAWVEGSSIDSGQYFEVSAVNINVIYNGYQATVNTFRNNARVKKFKVYMDGKPLCYLVLEDKMDGQGFQLPFEWEFEKYHSFRFEIVEIYPGEKWNDVGISEVDFVLCCVAEGTEVMAAPGQTLPVQSISEGSPIMSTDGGQWNTTTSNVTSFSEQWHNNLLEVQTAHHTVLATADHPFVSERHGTISMYRLKYTLGITTYSEFSSAQESLLVYDYASDAFVYEKIISVKEVPGNFKTYAVQGLTSGEYYVAGGFVSPVDERGVSSARISRAFFHLN